MRRAAFTLPELLITIAIIAILSGLGLSAYSGAIELGREERTRSIIKKIDQFITERHEEYRTRAVPIKIPAGATPRQSAAARLYALRDLMRMEMPERATDVIDAPATLGIINGHTVSLGTRPSAQLAYRRMAERQLGPNWADETVWTTENEGAECLYLILSRMTDGDKAVLDFFTKDEIGDTDEDGMQEILDGWGEPVHFLRWAPGYSQQTGPDGAWGQLGIDDDNDGNTDNLSEAGWAGSDDIAPRTVQTRNYLLAPDPFDPVKVDPRWTTTAVQKPFYLKPLVVSAGPDKQIDIAAKLVDSNNKPFRFVTTVPPSDPYFVPNISGQYQVGTPVDFDNDGNGWSDNITNHSEEG